MSATEWRAISNDGKFYVLRNDDTGEPELALDSMQRYRIFKTLEGAKKAAQELNESEPPLDMRGGRTFSSYDTASAFLYALPQGYKGKMRKGEARWIVIWERQS